MSCLDDEVLKAPRAGHRPGAHSLHGDCRVHPHPGPGRPVAGVGRRAGGTGRQGADLPGLAGAGPVEAHGDGAPLGGRVRDRKRLRPRPLPGPTRSRRWGVARVVPRGTPPPGRRSRLRRPRPGVLPVPARPVAARVLGPASGARDGRAPLRRGGGPRRHPEELGRDFAADGIDELLRGFHARPKSRVRTDEPRVLRVRANDTDGAVWTVRLTREPPAAEYGDAGDADCEVSGPAARLYLALWNRLPFRG